MTLWKDRGLAIAVFAFVYGFLYQMQEILTKHSAWSDFRTPAGTGEIIKALLFGLGAVGAALGLNLTNLVKGLFTRSDGT